MPTWLTIMQVTAEEHAHKTLPTPQQGLCTRLSRRQQRSMRGSGSADPSCSNSNGSVPEAVTDGEGGRASRMSCKGAGRAARLVLPLLARLLRCACGQCVPVA